LIFRQGVYQIKMRLNVNKKKRDSYISLLQEEKGRVNGGENSTPLFVARRRL